VSKRIRYYGCDGREWDVYSATLLGGYCIVITMSAEIGIRLTKPSDYASVHALVQTIADETFADLFASQVPIGEANWGSAWLAVLGEEIVGVTKTQDMWVSDLWVRRDIAEPASVEGC
jgi:hypothetical protein